jgi:hypothetical protein
MSLKAAACKYSSQTSSPSASFTNKWLNLELQIGSGSNEPTNIIGRHALSANITRPSRGSSTGARWPDETFLRDDEGHAKHKG